MNFYQQPHLTKKLSIRDNKQLIKQLYHPQNMRNLDANNQRIRSNIQNKKIGLQQTQSQKSLIIKDTANHLFKGSLNINIPDIRNYDKNKTKNRNFQQNFCAGCCKTNEAKNEIYASPREVTSGKYCLEKRKSLYINRTK